MDVMVKIIIMGFFPCFLLGQTPLNFSQLVEKALQNSLLIQQQAIDNELVFKEGEFRFLKWKPTLFLEGNLPNWNRSLHPIILPSGLEDIVYRTSAYSQGAFIANIPLPTGGAISIQSNLQRLDIPNFIDKGLSTEYAFIPISLGLQLPVLKFNRKNYDIRFQSISNQIASLEMLATQYEILNELVTRYTSCLVFLKEIQLLEEAIKNYSQLLKMNQELKVLGWGSAFNINNLKLALTQYQLQLQNLIENFRNEKRFISLLIDVDNQNWLLEATLPTLPDLSNSIKAYKESWLKKTNFLLPLVQEQHQLSLEDQERISMSRPVIGINMLLGMNGSGSSIPVLTKNWEWQQQFSINFSIPIWNQQMGKKGKQIGLLKEQKLQLEKKRILNVKKSQLEQLWSQYQNLKKARTLATSTEDWAIQSFHDAEILFKEGQITLLELNEAVNQKNAASKLKLSIDCQLLTIYYRVLQLLEVPIENNNPR
jgi:outer membrane protein TolC